MMALGMFVRKNGDKLLVPQRLVVNGAIVEGVVELSPGDDGYEEHLAQYLNGSRLDEEGHQAVLSILEQHRRGEL
jgi:hypothetical protein